MPTDIERATSPREQGYHRVMNHAPADARVSAIRDLLGADPLPWILASDEPYARWAALRLVLERAHDDPAVISAHDQLLADPHVQWLADALPHQQGTAEDATRQAAFAPNRLGLLADMGVGPGDFEPVDRSIDALLELHDHGGLFADVDGHAGRPKPETGSVLCDTIAITDVLLRFDRADDVRVRSAVARITHDMQRTGQGIGWRCQPVVKEPLFSRQSRAVDACPQISLEGLRILSRLPAAERPRRWLEAARTPLEAWRRSATERPCGFGHGFQFKSVRWPNFWYDVLSVLDAVGRFPELWSGPRSRAEDRRAIAELAACLIEYNMDPDGRVTPRRAYPGFERFSFGRKTGPSPFATAHALLALSRVADLAQDIGSVDVTALPSSRGATSAVQPKRPRPECPVPARVPTFTSKQATARVLIRHRLAAVWEPATFESLVADLTALNATQPASPYFALRARLPETTPGAIEQALFSRHSLVYLRAMRGALFMMRTDFVPIAFSATRRQTEHFARNYARFRGVTRQLYAAFVPLVLEAVADRSMTTAQIRSLIEVPTGLDMAALVNRMSTEGLIMRDRPVDGWGGHRWTWAPTTRLLPGINIDAVREEDADAALCRTYLRSFGPVTSAETAWWTGLGPRRTERVLQLLGDEVTTVRWEGVDGEFLMHAADTDELSMAHLYGEQRPVFLPAYDPLLMGYASKDRFMQPARRPYVFDAVGGCAPVVLLDGRVSGVWDIDRAEPSVLVHVFGANQLSEAIHEQARSIGAFYFGEDVPIRRVDEMSPLTTRGPGAARRPLRGR